MRPLRIQQTGAVQQFRQLLPDLISRALLEAHSGDQHQSDGFDLRLQQAERLPEQTPGAVAFHRQQAVFLAAYYAAFDPGSREVDQQQKRSDFLDAVAPRFFELAALTELIGFFQRKTNCWHRRTATDYAESLARPF